MFFKKKPTIYWCALTPNAIIPTKRERDAGYDLYCSSQEVLMLGPHRNGVFTTDLAAVIPQGYWVAIKERGSTGLLNLSIRSGVMDNNYLGEWKIIISNLSDRVCYVFNNKYEHGQKLTLIQMQELLPQITSFPSDATFISFNYKKAIAQAILVPLPSNHSKTISLEDFKKISSDRGAGWNGSSGK